MEHGRSRIVVIALSLLLALFGHDALMATEPHAAAAAHPESAAERDCGLTRGAQPQTAFDFDLDGQAIGASTFPLMQPAGGFLPHWSIDPDHPPATKRAMFQVYLN